MWNGGWGGWYDGRLSDEDIRQFRGEIGQLSRDARDLRAQLKGIDIDPRELEEVIRALRQLEDPRVYKDIAELARLQTTVAEGLKRFEFGLRRKVEGDQNAVVLNGADESPDKYKKLNEQYFRSLAKSPAAGK